MTDITVLILAAGKGTRMKSEKAKVLHPVGGVPMIELVMRAARAISDEIHVVVGHQAEAVRAAIPGANFIVQTDQLGTGHAVIAARSSLYGQCDDLLILPGDVPLIQPETLKSLVQFHRDGRFAASVVTAIVDNPYGYGRIIHRSENEIDSIREHRDSDSKTLDIHEVNSGIYLLNADRMFDALEQTGTDNAKKEYYLTDVFGIFSSEVGRVGAFQLSEPAEVSGINSRKELAMADGWIRRRKCDELMAGGVSILDPGSVRIDIDVRIGRDSTIYPSVSIEGRSILGESVTVRSSTRITNSTIGRGCMILDGSIIVDSKLGAEVHTGPFAQLRAGSVLEDRVDVGNFVEVKNSKLGEGSKARHLAYLGDAEIGKGANIGAGVITCNFDGEKKNRTTIEDGAFIGSNSALVAPVRIGKNSYVGAGSTITEDVPPDSLAIGRGRQVVMKDRLKNKEKS